MKSETKICKHCQTEIPRKAKVCPQCRKKQGGIVKWIILAFFFFMIIGAANSGNDDPVKKGEVTPGTENETASVSNEFKVGDIVETKDIRISYLSAEQYESKNQFIQPDNGNVYYKMDFEFENISKFDQYVSYYDFKCYADDYEAEMEYLSDENLISADLSSGKKATGCVIFQVPADAKSIVLEFEYDYWNESKIVFIVK